MLDVVDRLGKLDLETRRVADEKIKDLKSLYVEWKGKRWAWRAGVLSGWRLTSVLGTLASAAAYRYILKKTSARGGLE